MRKLIAAVLLVSYVAPLVAVDGDKAEYFGGTASVFTGVKDPLEGTLDTSTPYALTFTAQQKPHKGTVLSIPYSAVVDLEYGQKAGRRVGAAIGTSVLLGPIGLVTLFSKKRRHYLTVGYRDETGDQVAVLELGKDIVRKTLAIVETRSGKPIEYQDEDAKKSGR
jgi:hypothetical protein